MSQQNISGYRIQCDRRDVSTIAYKLSGLPFAMREMVASHYSSLYQTTYADDLAAAYSTPSQSGNPVFVQLAKRAARAKANAYLKTVMAHVKGHMGKETYLEAHDRLKLEFLLIWGQHAPAAILTDMEREGALDTDTELELKRARRSRWKAIREFLARENIPFPPGKPDSVEGNGSRFNRLVNAKWWQDKIRARMGRDTGERARRAGRIGKHGEHYLSDSEYQQWMDAQASAKQYMEDTVFISHDDDEVEMLDIWNGTTANPKNRKVQIITQVNGLAKFAEKYGYSFEMITSTAASAHHPAPTQSDGGRIVLNPKFDPAWTAKKTHAHLLDIWEKTASYLTREGVEFFAFRGAEPHLDGTPHHHYGLFYKNADGNRRKVHKAFKWYFRELDLIADELGGNQHQAKITPEQMGKIKAHLRATEKGAEKRRVTFVQYDPAKGSLSNYILKSLLNYVIKDVAVGVDADSTDGLTPKQQANQAKQQRVAAWASLHGIKQFTTLRTGASVGIYQELRRIRQPVEGSQQLEAERLACVGSTFGTDDHSDVTKRVDADYCAFMEARRVPVGGAEPVKLWKLTETESDNITIRLNEYSDEVGRIQGVRCLEAPGELLEINTRPLKWRAVNVPQLTDDVISGSLPPTQPGGMVDADYRESMTAEWKKVIRGAREEKTLHQFARGLYHFPESPAAGVPLRERAKPVTTWKIRYKPSFPDGSGKNAQNSAGGGHDSPTA